MKRILLSILVISVVLFGACVTPVPTPSPSTPDQAEDAVQELWQSLAQYVCELELAETIAKNKMNREAERLGEGHITTLEFRKRTYYAIVIQAHTIEYIDNKPDYAILNTFLWFSREDKKPPRLAWCIPELAADSEKREWQCEEYFTNYIQMHYWAIDEFKKTLREYESEEP